MNDSKVGFVSAKSFLEFSGNQSLLPLLLEYPGKTDGAAAGNLREPVTGPAFLFGGAVSR